MKRIYLLMIVLVAFTANSFAQADLALTTSVTAGQNFLANGGPGTSKSDTFQYSFKNLGPNALTIADTIIIRTPYGNYALTLPPASATWPGGLPKDSTAYWSKVVTLSPKTGATSGQNTNFNWCDSIYAKSTTGVVADPDLTNNKVCKTVTVTTWATSVIDVNGNASELNLYPNPATDVVTLKYNFSNTSATVVIRDMIGKVVYQQELGKNLVGEKIFNLPVSNLANGIYVVELTAGTAKAVSRVSVK